jgi:hypothetical protein
MQKMSTNARAWSVFPSFLIKMHEKGGNFCIFLLKIAEKRGKPTLKGVFGPTFL